MKKRFVKISKVVLIAVVFFWFVIVLLLNFQDDLLREMYPEKVWVHRVNSIAKLNEVQSKYIGVELDVVYDLENNLFEVYHPPAPPTGLSLNEYFEAIERREEQQIWLDFKNLDASNESAALNRLEEICLMFSISRNQIIVESRNPQFLSSFFNSGYRTSYYLPGSLTTQKDTERSNLLKQIASNIDASKPTFISTHKDDVDLLKENFPSKSILTWTIHLESERVPFYSIKSIYNSAIRARRKHKLLSDDQIKVVLHRYIARSGNY
ncbi:DUF2181 domain-containing protein [Dokdonia sinensis]|uniref:DUF2181 domain-containing protein n=1 Tax=Dokdonia sinensis TaxID=2479847 RepID=A0A3M0G6U9_9FLAO|nr:DUF2181 domain-containing protein [Dokdonia sinensis]RMB60624.1 DUF2181 domain-containing protein [Dokdonia sinensis]